MLQIRLRFASFFLICAVLATAFVPITRINSLLLKHNSLNQLRNKELRNDQKPYQELTRLSKIVSSYCSRKLINVIELSSISQQGKVGLLVGLAALAY